MVENNSPLPEAFYQGLSAYNAKMFFLAHELFEDAWRKTAEDSRNFYRALLHLSGGFFRLTQNRPHAARKFFSHAIKWLDQTPKSFQGFETDDVKSRVRSLLTAIHQNNDCDQILQDMFFTIQPNRENAQ